jgi:hypothetical protein
LNTLLAGDLKRILNQISDDTKVIVGTDTGLAEASRVVVGRFINPAAIFHSDFMTEEEKCLFVVAYEDELAPIRDKREYFGEAA